ncbi:N-acetyltransferase NAT2 [Fusarium albosuccineum]|uniref:N-acetyltransferase NAT2 n=1 Tax=Fusarium albosuccineum TaxID=1237068 RepID=A0A8H4PLR1_9HYPO|nr:N-acetyltransferase NAT2 [Fusarium albosuccineum]
MLRQPLRGVRAPIRAFNKSAQQVAWQGTWRRLFTSQAGDKTSRQVWRWRTGPWEGMMARLRSTRFGSTTTPGMLQGVLRRGFRFTARRKEAKGPVVGEAEEPKSLTARLKKLTKEYGWATVGVYFGLSVLDFPFCFLFVRIVGAETIGEILPRIHPVTRLGRLDVCKVEHYIVSSFKQMIPESVRETWRQYWQSFRKAEAQALGDDDISDKMEMATWGVEKAEERNRADATTQLALAYAIHKSFIFLRVPLTAAVTPKVVKVLRSWGWKIGKKSG